MQSFIAAQERTIPQSATHGIDHLADIISEAAEPMCTTKAHELDCADAREAAKHIAGAPRPRALHLKINQVEDIIRNHRPRIFVPLAFAL